MKYQIRWALLAAMAVTMWAYALPATAQYTEAITINGGDTYDEWDFFDRSAAITVTINGTAIINSTAGSGHPNNGALISELRPGSMTNNLTFNGSGTLIIRDGNVALCSDGDHSSAYVYFAMDAGSEILIESGARLTNGGWARSNWSGNKASLTIEAGAVYDQWDGNWAYIDALNGGGSIVKSNGNADYRGFYIGVAGGDGDFSGVISGYTPIVKQGSGTQILSGDNTYTAATTVEAGKLILTGTTASPTFDIKSGAELEINVDTGGGNMPNDTTFTGTGTLIKSGEGTLVWGNSKGTFAFSQGAWIDVRKGTFTGGSNANEDWSNNKASLNVVAGATFAGVEANICVDALTGDGTITSGYNDSNIPIPYQNFTFGIGNSDGVFDGKLANTSDAHVGNYIKAGTGTQTLAGDNTYTGYTTVQAGKLILSGSTSSPSFVVKDGATLETTNAFARTTSVTVNISEDGTAIITGGGAFIPAGSGHSLTFKGDGLLIIDGGATMRANGSTGGNVNFEMTGGEIQILAGQLFNGGWQAANWSQNKASLYIEAGAEYCQWDGSWTYIDALNGAGSIIKGTNDAADRGIYIGVAGGGGDFEGTISGNIPIVKRGTGTQTLSGVNTYTGSTTVEAGRLILGGTTASPVFNVANDAELVVTNFFNRTAAVTVNTDEYGKVIINSTVGGNHEAASSLISDGRDHNLTFTGNGQLIINEGGTTNGNVAIASNGFSSTVYFAMTGGEIRIEAGGLTNGGWSKADWTNNKASLYIAEGAYYDQWDGQWTYIDALNGGGDIRQGHNPDNGIVIGVNNGSGFFSGSISGNNPIIKRGTGTQTLAGNNTYTRDTTVEAGKLILIGTTASRSFNIANGAELEIGVASGTNTITAPITGSGQLTKSGAGTLTLTGTSSHSGAATVEAGTLNVTGSLASAITVNAGAVLMGSGGSTWGLTFEDDSFFKIDLNHYAGAFNVEGDLSIGDNVLFQVIFDDCPAVLSGREFGVLTNTEIDDSILDHLDFSLAGGAYYWNAWVNGDTLYVGVNENAVPEPATWAMILLGGVSLLVLRRRKM